MENSLANVRLGSLEIMVLNAKTLMNAQLIHTTATQMLPVKTMMVRSIAFVMRRATPVMAAIVVI